MSSQGGQDHCIRRVDIANGATTTLAGSGGSGGFTGSGTGSGGFFDGVGAVARFNYPRGIAIEPSGEYALVAVRASGLDSLHPLDSPQPAIPYRQRTRCIGGCTQTVFLPEMVPATPHSTPSFPIQCVRP